MFQSPRFEITSPSWVRSAALMPSCLMSRLSGAITSMGAIIALMFLGEGVPVLPCTVRLRTAITISASMLCSTAFWMLYGTPGSGDSS
eukprot:3937208-Rhodomonas_salina.12